MGLWKLDLLTPSLITNISHQTNQSFSEFSTASRHSILILKNSSEIEKLSRDLHEYSYKKNLKSDFTDTQIGFSQKKELLWQLIAQSLAFDGFTFPFTSFSINLSLYIKEGGNENRNCNLVGNWMWKFYLCRQKRFVDFPATSEIFS